MKKDTLIFIFIAIIIVCIYFTLPIGLYANDGGAKYIQMKSFYLERWKSLGIYYPGEKIGLDVSYLNPNRGFIEKNGILYCTSPYLFTFISSLFYPALGERVIHFLPLLSFFISMIVLARILAMVMKKDFFYYFLIFCFSIASPIFSYSITFWEHLPAVLCAALSLYYLVSYFNKGGGAYKIFVSSVLLGIGVFFRIGIFALIAGYVICLSWIFYKRNENKNIMIMLAGFLIPVGIYFLLNFIFYGNLLGLHAVYNLPPRFSKRRIAISLMYFFSALLMLMSLARYKDKSLLKNFYFLISIIWIWIMIFFFRNSPAITLFYYFPLVFIVFFNIGEDVEEIFTDKPALRHFLLGIIIIYITLIGIFLLYNPDPSVRYSLLVIPFIVVFLGASSGKIVNFKPLYILVVSLMIVSFFINSNEVKNKLLFYKYYNYERCKFLGEHTKKDDIVIFAANPLMEHCGPLFFDRIYIVSKKWGSDINGILGVLKTKGVKYCYYWTMDSSFTGSFLKAAPYKLTEFQFLPALKKPLSKHYLVKIEL